ncbi:MAG: ATP-binding protein [Myxococcales bacterium]|nr:ATP-binding protein [Myxococcales bacterium]
MIADGQLLRFRVANHRSLRDEQELSFIADGDGDARLVHPDGLDEAVLPVCAIYGANASGKTNVIDALAFMRSAVAYSQRMWEPIGGVPRRSFALGVDAHTPSTFVAEMMIEGARYEYGFAVDDEVVREEWLRAWPNGRKQEWFSRDEQTFEIGRSLHGENKVIEALVRPNSLFLSAAAQNNHEQLTPIFQWFAARLNPLTLSVDRVFSSSVPQWWGQFAAPTADDDGARSARERARELLAAADLGIEDFQVVEADRAVPEASADGSEEPVSSRRRRGYRLSFAHRTSVEPRWLDLRDESTGTRALVGLLPTLLPLLAEGGLLAIDEFNSLHPMLALALVQIFQDPARNPRGAQLLFNTHESSLLGNLLTDPAPLRRDQVWLTEKDRDGATHLYPLTDYTPRTNENLQRGYLQGRYGAVPFLGVFGAEGAVREST